MAKTITIPYKGKTYTLEYTRKTVSALEKQGFNIEALTEKPATMIPLLFHGSFLANHPSTKGETKETIFEGLKNKTRLVQTLAEMYVEAYNALLGDDEDEADEGNAGWGVVE